MIPPDFWREFVVTAQHSKFAAASAVAAILALAPAASAGTLLVGTHTAGFFGPEANGVQTYDGLTLAPVGGFLTPGRVNGLAYGGGSIFVSTSLAQTVTRYDLSGAQTGQLALPPLDAPQDLAYGGGQLFIGELTFLPGIGSSKAVISVDAASLAYTGNDFATPSLEDGLTVGGDSLFVDYDGSLARYDLSGNPESIVPQVPLISLSALTYGDGKLFAAYSFFTGQGTDFGIAAFDPVSFSLLGSFGTPVLAQGLVFGDGSLFASLDDGVNRYDENGVQTGHIDSVISSFGKLAYIPDPPGPGGPGDGCGSRICGPGGGVPEPAAWALMILGFGGVGLGLRAQRHCLNVRTRPTGHGPAIRGPLKDPASSSFGWIEPEWDTI
jgi:hypothetical protein